MNKSYFEYPKDLANSLYENVTINDTIDKTFYYFYIAKNETKFFWEILTGFGNYIWNVPTSPI